MKQAKIAGIALASFFILSCSGSGAKNQTGTSAADGTKKYEIKSGVVYYKPIVIMGGVKSTEILYFDEYGNKEAHETLSEASIMGMTTKERKMTITNGDNTITYELEKIENGQDITSKEAQKIKLTDDMKAMAQMFANLSDAEQLKKDMDYREEGTEMVAGVMGKKISIVLNKQMPDSRIYAVTYKNIPMKTEIAGIKMEVEKIEENVSVDPSKFKVPDGYTIVEMDMEKAMGPEPEN